VTATADGTSPIATARRYARAVRKRLERPYPVAWCKWNPPRPPFPAHQLGYASFYARQATASLRPLPDYLIIGAAKSATTSLYEYLAAHPAVCAPLRKEIWYFDRHYDRGSAWYRAHFPTRIHRARIERQTGYATLTGEATPSYLPSPDVPARVAALMPEVKLVVLLRNPVDRAISHYSMRVRHGLETRPIDDALSADSSYVALGRYAEQLERWFECIRPEQLLVLPSDELTSAKNPGFDQVLRFLDLAPWRPPAFEMYLKGTYSPTNPELRARLQDAYAVPNDRLWALLGTRWGWDEPRVSTP
jgi:hypothetical protein